MALSSKKKVILAKIEITQGVDAVPTGALNAILMTNVNVTPMEGQDISRNLDFNYFGAEQELPSGLHGIITGSTELVGHAAVGTAPAWGVLARMCALQQVVNAGVSVVYTPISSGFESGTIYFEYAGTRQVLTGVRGTGVLTSNSQGIPVIAWTLKGQWSKPIDQAPSVPVLTNFQAPQISNKANTPTFSINGVNTILLRNFELDFANSVAVRLLQNYEGIEINDSNAMIKAQVEAVPLATLDPFALANNQTSFSLSLVHGVGAGKVVTIAAPNCRMKRIAGYQAQDNIVEWPLGITPLPNAGNDQFSITLT
jgi:hypothetical protein